MNAFVSAPAIGAGQGRDSLVTGVPLDLAVDAAAARLGSGDTVGSGFISLAELATRRTGHDVAQRIGGSIDAWAADFFARGVTAWSAVPRDATPWQSYRAQASIDRSAELLGLRDTREHFAELPDDATRVLLDAARALDWPPESLPAVFAALWADARAWEASARDGGWTTERRGVDCSAARQLLAIRVSWELVLQRALGVPAPGVDGGRVEVMYA